MRVRREEEGKKKDFSLLLTERLIYHCVPEDVEALGVRESVYHSSTREATCTDKNLFVSSDPPSTTAAILARRIVKAKDVAMHKRRGNVHIACKMCIRHVVETSPLHFCSRQR